MKKLLLLLFLIPSLVMGKSHTTLICKGETIELATRAVRSKPTIDKTVRNNSITIQFYDNDRVFFDTNDKLWGSWGISNKLLKDCTFSENFIMCDYENQWKNYKTETSITIDRKTGGTTYDYSRRGEGYLDLVQARLTCELAEKNKF